MENTFSNIIIRSWLPNVATEADWLLATRWHGVVPIAIGHYRLHYLGERAHRLSLLPTFLQCHPVNLLSVPVFANEPDGLLIFTRTGKSRRMLPLLGCHLACFGLANAGYFYVVPGSQYGRLFVFTPPLKMLGPLPEVTINPKIPSHVLYAVTHPPLTRGWREQKVYDDFRVLYHTKTDTQVAHFTTPFFLQGVHELIQHKNENHNDGGSGVIIALGYSEEASLYFPEDESIGTTRTINPPRGCAVCKVRDNESD